MRTLEEIVDECYEKVFQEITKLDGDDLFDLILEYQSASTGKTIRRSWRDREKRLQSETQDNNKI